MVIKLPKDLERTLTKEAAELGLSLPDYVLRLLYSAALPATKPANGAELVAYWEKAGLVGTRQALTDSQTHARELRAQAQKRAHE